MCQGLQHTNANIRLLARGIYGDLGHPGDPVLDRIGDVRDDLNGPAQVITPTFPLLQWVSSRPDRGTGAYIQ